MLTGQPDVDAVAVAVAVAFAALVEADPWPTSRMQGNRWAAGGCFSRSTIRRPGISPSSRKHPEG
jgi:hypothetical protein